jgi:hypothetical protein
MNKLNPYESLLDGRPIEVILAATPEAIRSALAEIGTGRVSTRPAPEKWSAAETLAEDGPTIQPFDQDKWARYDGIAADTALEVFSALRKWNLRLIQSALPNAANRTMTHPERGAMTFQTVVETIAGHDLNHLKQLRKIAGTTL